MNIDLYLKDFCRSTNLQTRSDVKQAAKLLRQSLKDQFQQDVKHGHCLEMISRSLGFKNWNVFSAHLNKQSLVSSEGPTEEVSEVKKAEEVK